MRYVMLNTFYMGGTKNTSVTLVRRRKVVVVRGRNLRNIHRLGIYLDLSTVPGDKTRRQVDIDSILQKATVQWRRKKFKRTTTGKHHRSCVDWKKQTSPCMRI